MKIPLNVVAVHPTISRTSPVARFHRSTTRCRHHCNSRRSPIGSGVLQLGPDTGTTTTLVNFAMLVAKGNDPALTTDRVSNCGDSVKAMGFFGPSIFDQVNCELMKTVAVRRKTTAS